MDANKTVNAIFELASQYYLLTVNVVGNGTVTENPSSSAYAKGTAVTLTATPAEDWSFAGWTGDIVSSENTVTVIMNSNMTVTATFLSSFIGFHDVAIASVKASPTEINIGQPVGIIVEAANFGNFTETFNVSIFYDSNLIQTISITSMAPHTTKTLTVIWNTGNVQEGTYTISANATVVEGDVNPANNNFVDGQVTVISGPVPGQISPQVLILIFALVGFSILGGIGSILLLSAYTQNRRRRRKKIVRTPHGVIISHPRI
jgi:hypothetical protein